MKKITVIFGAFLMSISSVFAQTNPAITSWLQNTTTTGAYYVSGNSTTISNNILVNCQLVEYSTNNVFIHTKGIPSYPTGPFLDGNPSQAQDQDAIFKFPLNLIYCLFKILSLFKSCPVLIFIRNNYIFSYWPFN